MSTLKPETAPSAVPSAQAETLPIAQAQVQKVRRTLAKKPATSNKVTTKAVAKKPIPAKREGKKPVAAKVPDSRLAVKKPAAKKSLAKAFANAKPEKVVKAAKTVKLEKGRKPKLVRDSFTIPKVEYVVLEALKQRATRLNRSVKKSELLRAGIKALAAMQNAAFLAALELVPAIKTGRPASEK